MIPKILVIGVGNEMRGDDAIGVLLAKTIKALDLPFVTVATLHGDVTELYHIWQDASVVILVDAVDAHLQPGEWCVLDEKTIQTVKHTNTQSTHALSLVQTLELAKTLGLMPPKFYFVGVQVESVEIGRQLSAQVETKLPQVLNTILEIIHNETLSLNV